MKKRHIGMERDAVLSSLESICLSTTEAEGVHCGMLAGVPCSTKESKARPDEETNIFLDGTSTDKSAYDEFLFDLYDDEDWAIESDKKEAVQRANGIVKDPH